MSTEIQSVAYKDYLQEIQLDATKTALSGDKITFENRKRNILNSSQSKCTQKDDSAKQQTEPPKYDQNGAAVSNEMYCENKKNIGVTMSYNEFLKLFKPPPSCLTEVSAACSDEIQTEDFFVNMHKGLKCKSITSYFNKVDEKTKSNAASININKMTVTAQVHNSLVSSNHGSTQYIVDSHKAKNSSDLNKDADSIILLSTETIDDIEEKIKPSKLSTKKRKNIDAPLQQVELKKQKYDILNDNIMTDVKSTNQNLNNSVSSEPALGVKCSQSTLCFGKNGFSLVKSDIQKNETNEKELNQKQAKSNNDIKNGKKGTDNNEVKTMETDSPLTVNCDAVLERKNNKSVISTHVTEGTDIKLISVETPTLRRSARIKQAPKPVDDIVIDIDDNIEEEMCRNKKTKRNNISDEKIDKKQTGKLASIFTQVKSKGSDIKKIQPIVDPETLRLKREFLMSGIPEELKRQINTAANAALASDYPPFPKFSHVQQMEVSQTTPPSRSFKMIGSDIHEVDNTYLSGCFLWRTAQDAGVAFPSIFENFSAHPALCDEFVSMILKDYQLKDTSFNYEKMYRLWQRKLQAVACEEESTRPSKLSNFDEIIIVDDSPPQPVKPDPKQSIDVKECLWTDLYQPDSSDHVIGNSSVIQYLKGWLEKWKSSLQKEEKTNLTTKPLMKNKKTSIWSDDSDFTDSDEDDLKLCNTMLVTGPHGCGKTSTVYALALELGFKVFEVNSSSLRSGKQLLSQLEEATQSHKVAQKKTSDFGVDEVIVVENLEQKKFKKDNMKQKAKSDVMPLASSLTSFFKSNVSTQKRYELNSNKKLQTKDDKKLTQKQKKLSDKVKKSTNRLEETNEQNASSGHVNLSSVSLILFDEVDVVFEDDKGFLATVQHFMTSTKIPIILTCADRHFYHQLSARHDHIIFKKPSKGSVAKYLSTVCLSNGVYVDPTTMSSLVNHLNGDIRSCLLSLQYWCESGGGRVQEYSHSSHNAATATKPECGDKTSLFKVKCKKMMVIDDEESTSSVSSINMKPVKQKFAAVVHRDIVETLLGLPTGDQFSLQIVLKLLNVPVSDGQKFSEVLDQLPVMNEVFQRNCIYQVALVCLSLPKIEPSIVDMTASAKKVSIHKDTRKRILHSWCDSDSSDDSPDQNNQSEMRDSGLSTDNQCNKLNLACDAAKDNNTKLNISVLSEMARFYDSMSYIDCLQSTCNRTVEKCGTSPGINDMEPLYHQNYHIDHDFVNPTVCAVSLLASRKMSQNVDASINVWLEREGFSKNSTDDNSGPINIWPEEFQLPIGQSGTHELFNDNHLLYSSKKYATENNLANLGNVQLESDQKIYTDYLPYLREICRTEKDRHISKSQRSYS
ncbi:hypothetical protein Btru_024754 [Bulinus truncatus]|nr:hypothetical protein Btru_024754 [Bulinus truncatus]